MCVRVRVHNCAGVCVCMVALECACFLCVTVCGFIHIIFVSTGERAYVCMYVCVFVYIFLVFSC